MSDLTHILALGPKSTCPRLFAGSAGGGLSLTCVSDCSSGHPGLDSDHRRTSLGTFVSLSSLWLSLAWHGWAGWWKVACMCGLVWLGLEGRLAEEISDSDDAFWNPIPSNCLLSGQVTVMFGLKSVVLHAWLLGWNLKIKFKVKISFSQNQCKTVNFEENNADQFKGYLYLIVNNRICKPNGMTCSLHVKGN